MYQVLRTRREAESCGNGRSPVGMAGQWRRASSTQQGANRPHLRLALISIPTRQGRWLSPPLGAACCEAWNDLEGQKTGGLARVCDWEPERRGPPPAGHATAAFQFEDVQNRGLACSQ